MQKPPAAAALIALLAACAAKQREPDPYEAPRARIHAALPSRKDAAFARLETLVDRFGHRLSGSPALEEAIGWAVETMGKEGLSGARKEKVMVPRWIRGQESARIVSPVSRELAMLGLGGSVGTGGAPIRAEVLVVKGLEDLEARKGEAHGKIVVIDQAMPPFDPVAQNSFYGETVKIRAGGPSAGARAGAVAVLIRSVTAHSLRTPHTGATRYADDAPRIPAAALTVEDTALLARLSRHGPVVVELTMSATTAADAESGNAIAELRGRELPDEVVVVGGHIDSWDVGQGATDDGAGAMIALEAALMLEDLGLVPRRTVRVVLFTNEENGLRGAKAYAEQHASEKHAAAIEADMGSGPVLGLSVGNAKDRAAIEPLLPALAPLGIRKVAETGAGADVDPLSKQGVLAIGLKPDTSKYFDVHHSPADTLEKIDPKDLIENAGALALLAYALAER